jgi:hypothetical protein
MELREEDSSSITLPNIVLEGNFQIWLGSRGIQEQDQYQTDTTIPLPWDGQSRLLGLLDTQSKLVGTKTQRV